VWYQYLVQVPMPEPFENEDPFHISSYSTKYVRVE
jgi:hypothetical protein